MGCFTVLKTLKKKSDKSMNIKHAINNNHVVPTVHQTQARLLQSSPPSFRTNVNPIANVTNNRTRVSSGPSALDAAEQNAQASSEHEEQRQSKHYVRLMKERPLPTPQPLPLPPRCGALGATSSFKLRTLSGPLCTPEPLQLPPTCLLRNFMYEEIATACRNFSADRCVSECLSSTIYRASFGGGASSSKKFEATVIRLHSSTQGLKEFIKEVKTLASLQHPKLCKLLGFHANHGSEPRMLVYEKLYHGSLDRLLFDRFDGPGLDWNTRIQIAICAAEGLTLLHDEGPFLAMYNDFSTANIQIDKDFRAKLSGYGCVGHIPENEISNRSPAIGHLALETIERGVLTPKSNVWSFGIFLLELLTGRKNLDSRYPMSERNLVKWSLPFLTDDDRLSLIMDPKLKGRFPCIAARTYADIIKKCLRKEPSERPAMRTVFTHLRMVYDMKHSFRLPLKEPELISGNQMSRTPSFNVMISHAPRKSYSSPPPPTPLPIPMPSFASPRWTGVPALLPSPAAYSSSTLLVEDVNRLQSRKSSPSGSWRASVECQ